MIFLTVGSQKFEFDRLLKGVDSLIEKELINEQVIGQIGFTNYVPKNYFYQNFMDRESFQECVREASIVITHGGTGAIINSLKLNKPVIAIPRLASHEEHVDDHQKEIVNLFVKKNLIFTTNNLNELPSLIEQCKVHCFESFESNNDIYIKKISGFINLN